MAWARTNTREPSARRTANVPVPAAAAEHLLGQLGRLPGVAAGEREGQHRAAEQLAGVVGKPNSAAAKGLAYSRLPWPVGDHHRRGDLGQDGLRREVGP